MRHRLGRSAISVRFNRKFVLAAGIAGICGGASIITLIASPRPANADTIWVSKDCTVTPCQITTGGTPAYPGQVPGRFRVTSSAFFNWSATYFGTVQNFWVSPSGMNMATNKLSTSPGQLGGSVSLPGTWYISAQTALMGGGNYSVSGANVLGDPHITTLDMTRYDFQGAGEFTLLRNKDSRFEVQSRMTPVSTVAPLPPDAHTGISSCPSINTAAAVRTPRHRLSYQPGPGRNGASPKMQLRIDGTAASVPSGAMTLNDGTRVMLNHSNNELNIRLRNGWGVRIVPTWWAATGLWYLNYEFSPATSATGIAGPLAGRSWLPALSDGSGVGSMPASISDRYKILYEKFANSWRVNAVTSLFDYRAGQSPATFANHEWPGESGSCHIPGTTPLPQIDERKAAKICERVIPSFKQQCVADVMATGDRIFATGYLSTQGPVRYKTRGEAPRNSRRG